MAVITFDVIDIYHAVQIAIGLQRWRIEHGKYPSAASSMNELPPDLWGLWYEPTADGRGYRLSGNRGTLLETPR